MARDWDKLAKLSGSLTPGPRSTDDPGVMHLLRVRAEDAEPSTSLWQRVQALEERFRNLAIRNEAISRVLFRLIDYNRECSAEILNHLFIKKRHSRKELLEFVNADVNAWGNRADYYDGFEEIVSQEVDKMEAANNDR